MKSEKAIAETTAHILTANKLSMNKYTPNLNNFKYHCSFCAVELQNVNVLFNGVGACPACDGLAHLWVDSLREYKANYFNNVEAR